MSRPALFALIVAGFLSQTTAARIDVAPAPREIRPDGSRDPAPQPAATNKEHPLEVVKRIIANSNAVGDKLAMTDTGAETLGKQETILKDIKSLIDQEENPPPQPDQDKNDQKSGDSSKKDDMPMGGMSGQEDKKDSQPVPKDKGMGGMPPPMGGMGDDQPMGRRPRQQAGKEPKDKSGSGGGGQKQSQPMTAAPMQPPKNTGGRVPDPKPGDPKTPSVPLLPQEDDIVKEVWGHLPDKMRQQATQYYQQDFMPRYTELLKLYYSSLAEKGGKR
jgi:hypothetical protein